MSEKELMKVVGFYEGLPIDDPKSFIDDRLGRNSFPFVDSLIINKKTRAYGKLLSCALVFIKVK